MLKNCKCIGCTTQEYYNKVRTQMSSVKVNKHFSEEIGTNSTYQDGFSAVDSE